MVPEDGGELVLLSQKRVSCATEVKDVVGGCGRAQSVAVLQDPSHLGRGVGGRARRAQAAGAALLHRHKILLTVAISLLAGWGSSNRDLFLI